MGIELMLAYSLDLVFGDPLWLPHPVRAIGRAITALENHLRRTSLPLRLAGMILVVVIVPLTYAVVCLLIQGAFGIDRRLGWGMNVFLVYMAISVRSLAEAANRIYLALSSADIEGAREYLAQIVSRETAALDEGNIVRGAVESVAENTVDGIISPLFYAVIGGAPLVWAYKAINTLDSMIGHKNAKYLHFGWFAARLDDVANLLPARLSAVVIPAASLLVAKNPVRSLRTAFIDGHKSESPNAGFPEAAFAGALGLQLGGSNTYDGKRTERPLIGRPLRPRSKEDIKQAIHLMYASSLLALIGGMIVA